MGNAQKVNNCTFEEAAAAVINLLMMHCIACPFYAL
jgi:hypothetical protein